MKREARLLVVDDNADSAEVAARWFEGRGYAVTTALTAREAEDALGREAIDLILLDIMMPGTSGLDFLQVLRRHQSAALLPVIITSALHQDHNVIAALQLGANDYVTKPLDFPVVEARVATQLAVSLASRALAAANQKMKRDLRAAAAIQQSFLPAAAPAVPGVKVAWGFRPSDEIGGDIFNVFPLPGGRLALFLLDVSGHGVPAALTAVGISRQLTAWPNETKPADPADRPSGHGNPRLPGVAAEPAVALAPAPAGAPENEADPAQVATRLNKEFAGRDPGQQYLTLFYGVVDPDGGEIIFVSAGHPPPVHVPRQGPAVTIPTTGFPIGWVDDPEFENSAHRLQPGDRLFICSDGITEARNADNRQLGKAGLVRHLEQHRELRLGESVSMLMDNVRAWTGRDQSEDDLSVVALEIVPR